ncbi:hypothetical protein Tco_0616117 [Tanacetum coccineum]
MPCFSLSQTRCTTRTEMALGLSNPFYLSKSQRKQQSLYNGNVLLEKLDPPNDFRYHHNGRSSAHQEIHKILKEEIFPIINQVDSRLQNFEIQFLKEAAKFVRDFKSLAKEADESLAKHKTLELEIERLLRAVVSQDIMSIVQNPSVVDSSNLHEPLDVRKNVLKMWEIQGKSTDTPCVSNTLDPLSQKLENENVELEFQVRNYEKEIAHLKTTYKNLFDSISVSRAQTKTIIDSLQHKLHDTIYENAKLRAQLFDKVSDQKDTNKGMSANTKFAKQSILGKPPSSSRPKPYAVPTLPLLTGYFPRVIAPGIFRINPVKANRVANFVPNKHVKTSVRTKPITVSQPHDDCVRQYVNGMKSRKKNQSANVSKSANQKKIRWSPTGRFFDLQGKIIASSKSESQSDCSKVLTWKTKKIMETMNVTLDEFSANAQVNGLNQIVRLQTRSSKKKGSVRFSALYLKKKRNLLVFSSVDMIVMTSMVELESIFGHLFDELSNGENQVVSKSSAVTTADASDKCQQQQDSTSSTSTLATAITADGNFRLVSDGAFLVHVEYDSSTLMLNPQD